MSRLRVDDLSKDLELSDIAEIRGGMWDYVNRLGLVGQHLEDARKPPSVWDNGMSIEDAANAGDDSAYYPGLTPLR